MLNIKAGANYGHPYEGTYDTRKIRTDEPIWTLDNSAQGSAGIEWAENVGLPPGLLIGGPHLTFVPLSEDEDGIYVPSALDVGPDAVILDRQGFMTVVQAGPRQRLFIGVFGFRQTSDLHVFKLNLVR